MSPVGSGHNKSLLLDVLSENKSREAAIAGAQVGRDQPSVILEHDASIKSPPNEFDKPRKSKKKGMRISSGDEAFNVSNP